MLTPRHRVPRASRLLFVVLCAIAAGCASFDPPQSADLAQATLPVPEAKVRAAVVQVREEGGYRVRQGEDGGGWTTEYRQETDSPSDWMLRVRFGTGRSRVEVRLTPEGATATRLAIHVTYEGKDGLFESWTTYPTPLPQSAEHQLRLVKSALGLL
ncbi:MAG: hypothetical protein KGL03_06970 [Nitrospirota bacterium]|nr:hypothetical protein [Nitrospirota bacterium]